MNKSLGIYNLIDSEEINKSIRTVVDSGINFNTYVSPKGMKELRESIADFLKSIWDYNVNYKDIIITSGSQQSLNLLAYALFNEGNTILVEQPTYFGALDVFKKININLLGCDLGEDGFDLQELEDILAMYKPRAIYVTPTFNNPTGYAWSNEVRSKFLDIINKYDVLVIEDDPYSLINYTDYKYRTLYEMNNGKNIIYLGTFSKLISPSINVGYIICSDGFMNVLYSYKNSFDLCTSAFLQYAVLDYLNNNDIKKLIKEKIKIYKELLDESVKQVENDHAVISYTRCKGGLFYKVTFEDTVNSEYEDLSKYYINGQHNNETRINICSLLYK